MIFVDANIPMYLVGRAHRHKVDAQHTLERLVAERRALATSSEVFQEILHRYASVERRGDIELAFETLRGLVDHVLSVEEPDVFLAKDLVQAHPLLSARDALHVAVMRRNEIGEVLSFDTGFDTISGISRIPSTPAGR